MPRFPVGVQLPLWFLAEEMGSLFEVKAGRGQSQTVDLAIPVRWWCQLLVKWCSVPSLCFSHNQGASVLVLSPHSRELSDSILCHVPYLMSCGLTFQKHTLSGGMHDWLLGRGKAIMDEGGGWLCT